MGANMGLKRAGMILVCALFLILTLPARAEEEALAAPELTYRCTVTFLGTKQERAFALTDGKINTSCRMKEKDELILEAPEDMGALILRFYQQGDDFLLIEEDEQGGRLQERTLTAAAALPVFLGPGCRRVRIEAPAQGLRICELMVFGLGRLPEDVPHPEPPLKKADFLLVSTHPDDEWVFLGGVYPIYGGERGYAGTVVYVTLPTWERAQECINGLWIGGVRTHPVFLGFPDVRQKAPKREKDTFRREEVTRELVRLYRRIRPLVVVTQDPENGEYGHWQHILVAAAAFDAVELAADPNYDPSSAAAYGVWTVQKMYQHFAQGISALELDVDEPLSHYGGRTALEVAAEAFQAHRTQLKTPYRPGADDEAKGDIRHFGLTWSMVGPDTGNDLFEHIPAEALAANQQPTPPPATAAPERTSTPGPTAGPTDTPTPTAAATAEALETPAAPSPWDRAEDGAAWAAAHAEALSAGAVLLLVLLTILRQVSRARHTRRTGSEAAPKQAPEKGNEP